MREIKFRVFDKFHFELLTWEEITGFGFEIKDVFENTQFELMQYIGLKDMNGVEIYEGDIVRVFDSKQINQLGQDGAYVDVYLDELDEVDFIIFKDGGFALNRTGLDVSVCQSIEEFTVIGNIYENIYENPELLEVEE